MKKFLTAGLLLATAGSLLFSSCKKEAADPEKDTPTTSYPYLMISNESQLGGPGYLTAFSKMPNGEASNVTDRSLQVAAAFGFMHYKSWIFTRYSTAGAPGIQRYQVDAKGHIVDAGFLPNGQNFHIVSPDKGYYLDPSRGTMLLQTFNPSTMQRTGQIDLSELALPEAPYNAAGQNMIADKEGKLYVGITHASDLGGLQSGFGDDTVVNYVELAVIDIATNQLEKTIKYAGLGSLGWGTSTNSMCVRGDDGALYFCATGMSLINGQVNNSAIIRIQKGATDFDPNWIIRADDYQPHATFGDALIQNGKIYVQLPSEPITTGFTNLNSAVWDYYAIDMNSKAATKITGLPQTSYALANGQSIVSIDGHIYLAMRNIATGANAYYQLDEQNNTATETFNLTDGGVLCGFTKLEE